MHLTSWSRSSPKLTGAIGRECGNEPGDSLKASHQLDGVFGVIPSFFTEHQQTSDLSQHSSGLKITSIWLRPLEKYISSSDKFLLKPTRENKNIFLSKWKIRCRHSFRRCLGYGRCHLLEGPVEHRSCHEGLGHLKSGEDTRTNRYVWCVSVYVSSVCVCTSVSSYL